MKGKFIIVAIALGVVLTAASVASDTSIKLGYMNSQELLDKMPEVQEADAKIQKFSDQIKGQLQTMGQEYQKKYEDIQNLDPETPESQKRIMAQELMDLEQRIQNFQDAAQQEQQQKKQTLYQPIINKVNDAIKEIAKENHYTYIFDASYGSLLYADEATSVMDLVAKKLGVDVNASTEPGTGLETPKTDQPKEDKQ